MESLNEQQQRAATAGDGPLIIIAGPGTGKTKTLTARIVYLMQNGVQPNQILALTFTKKAAEEMRTRVLNEAPRVLPLRLPSPDMLAGVPAARDRGAPPSGSPATDPIAIPTIATFHALCGQLLGGDHTFATESERLAIIKKLTRPASLKPLTVRELGLRISRAKNLADDDPAVAHATQAYNQALHQQDLIDFDDLLLQARDLLKNDPGKRPYYSHILVDEFQDTNQLQYELLQLLKSNDNLFVIGDPNQSIYAFRGASGSIFGQFKADFPNAQEIPLTINYRSAPQVVRLSNAIFAQAPQLQAHVALPGAVRAVQVLNEYSEAAWVLTQIQQSIGGADLLQAHAGDVRHSLRDFAILYRSRPAAMAMQKAVAESGLPYQIVGEGSPYEKPDTQRLIALLRCLDGERTPVTGLNPQQVTVLLESIDATKPPAEVAAAVASACAIAPTRDITHVIGTLVRFKTLAEAVAHFAMLADQHFYDPQAEAVTLLTIHAAKGLEFPHVFLIGAEEGILPSAKADPQEEKRLFYVAATRAKENLDILYTTKRGGQPASVSRFVAALPGDVLPKQRDQNLAGDARRAQKRQAKRAQATLF